VVLTLAAVALGLAIGLALPARRTRFARPRVHKWGLLVTGVAGQVIAARTDGEPAASLMLLSLVLLAWFAIANLHLTGMGVLAIGLCTNIVPIVLNQGMPVRAKALVHADVVDPGFENNVVLTGGRHLADGDDRLVVLSDIIPVPAAQQVLSFGDLIVFVATIDVIVHLVRRQRRTPAHSLGRHGPREDYGDPTFDLRDVADLRDSTIERQVQDWGEAPSPVPSSGSQNSASPDDSEPRTVVSATGAPASHSR
jgi:hypothetical protein